MAGSKYICHKDNVTDVVAVHRHPFNKDTINDRIKLSAQTSFMEKGTVQHKEK